MRVQSLYLAQDFLDWFTARAQPVRTIFVTGVAFRVAATPGFETMNITIALKLVCPKLTKPAANLNCHSADFEEFNRGPCIHDESKSCGKFVDGTEPVTGAGSLGLYTVVIDSSTVIRGNWKWFRVRESYGAPHRAHLQRSSICPAHIWRRCRFEVPPGSGLIIEAAKDDSAWATGGGVFMKSIPGSKRSVTGYSDSKAGPYPFSAPISSDLSMQARSLFWPMSPSERHRARITDRTADARGFRCKTYVHIYQDRMRWQECDRD
jgi:hypothetical protein